MGSQSPSKGVVIPLDPGYNNVANGLNTLHSQLNKKRKSDQITVGPDHHLRKLFSLMKRPNLGLNDKTPSVNFTVHG